MDTEGTLDPWVARWLAENPVFAAPPGASATEMLEMARGRGRSTRA